MRLPAILVIGLGFLATSVFSAEEPVPVEVRLFGGMTHRGVVVQEDDDTLVIRTASGEKRLARREIVQFRRQFTPEERAQIVGIVPKRAVVVGETVAPRAKLTFEIGRVVDGNEELANLHAPVLASGRQADWGLQISASLSRHLTLEFVETNLEEALNFIATLTRLNIVVNPKVREKNLKVSLSVRDMDAANVLKWVARLTDTYIELNNQALYVTDKPTGNEEEEERAEALMLVSRVGADASVLPAEGQPMTNEDRIRIAMAIWEKENPKPTDFPAPELDLSRPSFLNPSNLLDGR